MPVFASQAVVLEIPKDCLSIATLRWEYLPSQSQGAMALGDDHSSEGKVVLDSKVDNGSKVTLGYKLLH